MQVLEHSSLDGQPWQRGLRLIRKISKARKMVPSSYLLEAEHIRIGEVRYYGGSADVSDGEYQGRTVAVKHLRMKEDPDGSFKVSFINPQIIMSLTLRPAVVPRDRHLEAPIPPEHFALVRGIYHYNPAILPYPHRMDA